MTTLPDARERQSILLDLDRTLLVEAAAGTGKTALLAGRVVMLLLRGAEPAAITFTDLAAGELAGRVHHYVGELLAGRVPDAMRHAMPSGPTAEERRLLQASAARLDELTTATIHGFCQLAISTFAVEAGLDPGVTVMDAARAQSARRIVFDAWLDRRLSTDDRPDDPIVILSRHDPRRAPATLWELMEFRLEHRSARAQRVDLSDRPEIGFVAAVHALRDGLDAFPREPSWTAFAEHCATLATLYTDAAGTAPNFERLWTLAHPPSLACMRPGSSDLVRPRSGPAWRAALGERMAKEAERAAGALFDEVERSYRTMLGAFSGALIAELAAESDELLAEYAARKVAAAAVDFDDLLEVACTTVRRHEPIRQALGERFQHILVDEFQDTDPRQAETLFRIAARRPAERWQDCELRPGALFLVGDPKQAVYAFRGADVDCYQASRSAIERQERGAVLAVTVNFRSRKGIVEHVNSCYAQPLGRPGQPGYVPLSASIDDGDRPAVARLDVRVGASTFPNEARDAEADAVAAACVRLIGQPLVRTCGATCRVVEPADIVLLTPTFTELWRYERALEERGLAVASRAGKALFRRQEAQDVVALVRTLADPDDTLALGALLRGPLIGLTDGELLDATAALPAVEGQTRPRISGRTPPDAVPHPIASATLAILADLRRKSRSTTPALLLEEALDALLARPTLKVREGARSARALANLELLCERAKEYDVRGLRTFARELHRDWHAGTPQAEGRIDVGSDAVEIISMHGSKGLEWPVVIPINSVTGFPPRAAFVHRADDDTLHWALGDVRPPDLDASMATGDARAAQERERLWYVASTRARDLLVLPRVASAGARSWAGAIDLGQERLADLDAMGWDKVPSVAPEREVPSQSADTFQDERRMLESACRPVRWLRPSEHDTDRIVTADPVDPEWEAAPDDRGIVLGGRLRGLILHKLIEETLSGETQDEEDALRRRATVLLGELRTGTPSPTEVDVNEVAATAVRTLRLPQLAGLRGSMVSECPVYDFRTCGSGEQAIAGRLDAIALDEAGRLVVIDWKSDAAPSRAAMIDHVAQVQAYMGAIGAHRGAVVYMTPGTVHWVGDP